MRNNIYLFITNLVIILKLYVQISWCQNIGFPNEHQKILRILLTLALEQGTGSPPIQISPISSSFYPDARHVSKKISNGTKQATQKTKLFLSR